MKKFWLHVARQALREIYGIVAGAGTSWCQRAWSIVADQCREVGFWVVGITLALGPQILLRSLS